MAAGATAMLTGLIFVAVSINLARILEFPELPERAAQTIVQLLAALIVSLIGLVPGQSGLALGVELAVAGSILWILQTRLLLRSLKDNDQRPIISIVLGKFAAARGSGAAEPAASPTTDAYAWGNVALPSNMLPSGSNSAVGCSMLALHPEREVRRR